MDLLDQVSRLRTEGGLVLWMRQGAKYRGPTVDSIETVLNPESAARAREFGKRIGMGL